MFLYCGNFFYCYIPIFLVLAVIVCVTILTIFMIITSGITPLNPVMPIPEMLVLDTEFIPANVGGRYCNHWHVIIAPAQPALLQPCGPAS